MDEKEAEKIVPGDNIDEKTGMAEPVEKPDIVVTDDEVMDEDELNKAS